jgi:hypothetical protein
MGMFDYFYMDASLLPFVPDELKVYDNGLVVLQTKDTPSQWMSTYIQDANFTLKMANTGLPADEISTVCDNDKLSPLGHFEVRITDTLYVYSNLKHAEYNPAEPDRYIDGWIEYDIEYVDRVLQTVELYEHREPYSMSDDELYEHREFISRIQVDRLTNLLENRKINPSVSQKLIDSIDSLIDEFSKEETCHSYSSINNIRRLINEYRETHDPYYRKSTEGKPL